MTKQQYEQLKEYGLDFSHIKLNVKTYENICKAESFEFFVNKRKDFDSEYEINFVCENGLTSKYNYDVNLALEDNWFQDDLGLDNPNIFIVANHILCDDEDVDYVKESIFFIDLNSLEKNIVYHTDNYDGFFVFIDEWTFEEFKEYILDEKYVEDYLKNK